MTTITYHQIDGAGRPTGVTMTRDAAAGVPLGWVDVAPPVAGPGEVAEWRGPAWVLVAADLDAERLAAARAGRLAEVIDQVQRRLDGAFSYGGHDWQLGPDRYGVRASTNITAKSLEAALTLDGRIGAAWPENFAFIAADNVAVPMTAEQMIAFGAAASTYVTAVRMRGQLLRAQVIAATSEADLAAIDVGAGWP